LKVVGIIASKKARQRIADKTKKEEEVMQNRIKRIYDEEPNAAQAAHLVNLLQKKWNENEGSYIIRSKIDEKSSDRLRKLLSDSSRGVYL
jgi:hypothetical protein